MIEAPYGLWDSPITAEKASSAIVAFQDVVMDGDTVYWSEMRPTESGRYVIVNGKTLKDVLPPEFNARTRVHEYGGAAFTVHQGTIFFTNFQDQRLYKIQTNQKPVPLTSEGIRFAQMNVTPFGMVAIAEDHRKAGEPENFLALIDFNSGNITALAKGYDFYSSPALSQDFKHIAWICWNHPNMPWDETQLWVADLKENSLSNVRRIDEGFTEQAFFQPQWGPQNQLVVVSDKSNWWNLYQVHGKSLELLFGVDSEIGQPLWNLGASTWGFFKDGILCSFFQDGKNQLFFYQSGKLTPMAMPYAHFAQLRTHQAKAAFVGGGPNQASAVVILEKDKPQVLRESTNIKIEPEYFSKPEHITFASKNNRQSHAYYYPPANKKYVGLKKTQPPLIVKSHGGPTANCGSNLNFDIQYWTSRGFAVVDVNYAGSTGYGRAYRKSLEGNWGLYDVEDCESAALYLAQKGLADPHQFIITGGSAGGYTTLAALTFTPTFHVGASLYGVSDLEALVKETHKFESRYLDRLIGPYPEEKQKYQDRSPIHHVEKLSKPVIFFQGDEDKIVPPNQAQMMYDALVKKGIKTEYCLFQGEQHGFRKAQNRIAVLEKQKAFYIDALEIGHKKSH